jgi:hypothetical protein
VKSRTTDNFWKCYDELPVEVRKQAKEAYRLFEQDPFHPGLHFKRVSSTEPVFSARISRNYRSVGIIQGDTIIWFWIGAHDAYKKLIGRL